MNLVFESIVFLVILGIVLFFVMALLSPFESLGWWAGWSKKSIDQEFDDDRLEQQQTQILVHNRPSISLVGSAPKRFLVYLRGIATADAQLSRREQGFLDHLFSYLPNSAIISDVFPYSATNNPLTGERTFARLYQLLHNARERYRNSLFSLLFVLRNLFQVAVSGDGRYGPIYNAGIARAIGYSLLSNGYTIGCEQPIWVMGWSGGGQISVGSARYLHRIFNAPVYVVSIGGVILDGPAIADVEHLYHLEGSRDNFPRIGDFFSPGRWKIVKRSFWNQAWNAGRITVIDPGPMKHTGGQDYFDHKNKLSDGKTYAQRTAQVIAEIVREVES